MSYLVDVGATKASVASLSDCLRMELAGKTIVLLLRVQVSSLIRFWYCCFLGFNVNVMCVSPGAIASGIGSANDAASSSLLKPSKRFSFSPYSFDLMIFFCLIPEFASFYFPLFFST